MTKYLLFQLVLEKWSSKIAEDNLHSKNKLDSFRKATKTTDISGWLCLLQVSKS